MIPSPRKSGLINGSQGCDCSSFLLSLHVETIAATEHNHSSIQPRQHWPFKAIAALLWAAKRGAVTKTGKLCVLLYEMMQLLQPVLQANRECAATCFPSESLCLYAKRKFPLSCEVCSTCCIVLRTGLYSVQDCTPYSKYAPLILDPLSALGQSTPHDSGLTSATPKPNIKYRIGRVSQR
jgi:hypothetical protein